MAYGIRKVNEYIVRPGRALVLNGQDVITSNQWNSIADGTLYVSPGTNNNFIKYKKTGSALNEWSKFKPIDMFDALSIDSTLILNSTITQAKMAINSIGTAQIINSNVTTDKIANGAIAQKHFTDNTLSGTMFVDKSIPISKINGNFSISDLTGSISGSAITDGTISYGKLAANSVGNSNLINSCVTNTKMATSSVSTANIIDLNVTYAKLAKQCVKNDSIFPGSIENSHIGAGAVANTNIADGAVTNSKIALGTITNDRISDGTLTALKIAPNTIDATKFTQDLQAKINAITSIDDIISTKGDFQVNGKLTVVGNITASPANKTRSIEGFKVYNPVFADYAEGFVPEKGEDLQEGDIVELNKYGLIRKAMAGSKKVVGVVSNQYGLCLGASEQEIENGTKIAVGLIGKVPVSVIGEVNVGDMIVSAGEGIGIVSLSPKPYTTIGIALEEKTDKAIGKISCLIK